ncbi:Hypothetical protein D9617_20g026760 [Elsinoe fawcettii]|nr:Hypothetical protein D9617_20g026760 [Elsinoe fawcettii]
MSIAEEGSAMLKAMDEAGSKMGEVGEAGEEGGLGKAGDELKSTETVLEDTKAEIQKMEDNVKMQGKDSFTEGVNEVKNDVEELKDPTQAAKIKSKWTVQNIWENAKSFGKFVGIEAAKGALCQAGMEAVQKIAEAIEKKSGDSGDGDDGSDSSDALALANKLAGVSQTLQSILDAWLLWFANHYDNKDDYGSVSVEGTDISRFQIVQNKISDASSVLETKVAPAITVATNDNNLASIQSLQSAYTELYTKMAAVSDDITTKEQKMVTDGLDASQTDLNTVKATLGVS